MTILEYSPQEPRKMKIHVKRTVLTLALSGLAFSAPWAQEAAASEAEAGRPRSVLFYLMDTCRHDRMGYDGYERETTPFLEWLAERSVVFETSYSQAPWTKPSMASMLTSQYPSTTGVYRVDHRLPDELVTWPEHLRANGLITAGFSANIVMGESLSNFAQGFDHFTESTLINRADPIRFASGSAAKLNEHAFAWLEQNDRWPMLLYMHSVDPHEEYEPEPEYLARFADPERHDSFRLEWQKLIDSRPAIPGLYVTQDNFDRTQVDAASFIEHASNLYDADVRANDDQMQVLWNKLQEDGWGEDFVFVFTSDHGEEFFDHGGTSHGYSLYDEMIRVPLMIYAPGLLPGGVKIKTPVRSLDIYPTLCELLGFEVPEGLEGDSLVPLIRGEVSMDERRIFSEHREDPVLRRMGQGSGVMSSLRTGKWKFILNQEIPQLIERPRFELYDLDQDPDELVNLADQHPDLVKEFELEVANFVADHRSGASLDDWMTMDPEVLEQLRALGYVGEDEDDGADIWEAMDSGDLARIRAALEQGANANELDEAFGVSPLGVAAMQGDVELAELLLEAGAAVETRNQDGSTPLSGAAFLGRVDCLLLLLDAGANPRARNAAGDSIQDATQYPWDPTEYVASLFRIELDRKAVEEGRLACYEILAQRLEENPDSGENLFAAIESGDSQGVRAALEAGGSLEDRDPARGWTPLYTAVFFGQDDIAALLLVKGAEVHARVRDNGTAMHAAALMDRVTLVELLLEEGAKVDDRDGNGSTPLHAAAFLGRVDTVASLLEAGADPAAKDSSGRTPTDLTRTDWQSTQFILQLLGLELKREEVEENRAVVAELLGA